MPETHVVPTNDSKDHRAVKGEECWCKPQVQNEGKKLVPGKRKGRFKKVGKDNLTIIHKPILPVVLGHNLKIRKVLLDG